LFQQTNLTVYYRHAGRCSNYSPVIFQFSARTADVLTKYRQVWHGWVSYAMPDFTFGDFWPQTPNILNSSNLFAP